MGVCRRRGKRGRAQDSRHSVRQLGRHPHPEGSPSYTPTAGRTADGRLWFLAPDGMSVLDPRNLPHNTLPPPVHIEKIIADRNAYDPPSGGAATLTLPPLLRDLQIDYTATSL